MLLAGLRSEMPTRIARIQNSASPASKPTAKKIAAATRSRAESTFKNIRPRLTIPVNPIAPGTKVITNEIRASRSMARP